MSPKPRLVMLARGRYRFPLDPPLRRKLDALSERFDLHVAGVLDGGDPGTDARFHLWKPATFRGVDGPWFFAALPLRAARLLRRLRPDAVLVQGAHETAAVLAGRRLGGVRTPVILDLHGDWRAPTRLYGSPARRALSPLADAAAAAAVRRADAVRTISAFTSDLVRGLGREPAAEFPAYVDLDSFLEAPPAPLPDPPQALFVGVLERYKNVDRLVEAWRRAAPRVPDARLLLIGRGRERELVERLVADLPERTEWRERVSQAEVAAALDASTVLLLPSRSEGLPRIAMEAFCRGRGVVGSRRGGIPDLLVEGENGLLVDADDVEDIVDAVVRVLGDRALAERLASGARASADRWAATPETFAARVAELVEKACR